MIQNKIVPWDLDDQLGEFFVPDYIEEMATEVLEQYDFNVSDMEIMATKGDKGAVIWKLETDKGPKSLKFLHRRPTRSLFSIAAQQYLVGKGALVPEIIKTKSGDMCLEMGGKLWFATEWIEPLRPLDKDLESTKRLCHAVGLFHQISKGYVPPKKAELASRLHKWPNKYEKVIRKMEWFRTITRLYPEMPASSIILSNIDKFEEQGKKALAALYESPYKQLIAKGHNAWGLAHQDYGWSNGQLGPNGVWIIDLDGVAFDIPIRDVRKLMNEVMFDFGYWDLEWIMGMLEAYHEAYPIDEELFETFLVDLTAPNLFYKHVKDMVYEPTLFLDEELQTNVERILQLENTKWDVIEALRKEWKGGKR